MSKTSVTVRFDERALELLRSIPNYSAWLNSLVLTSEGAPTLNRYVLNINGLDTVVYSYDNLSEIVPKITVKSR